ncbi:MAG: UvrB/UvrC motif-containing protein [bacterium]|nr:UvrB/UvrC motif-containing protein [bacterium]
MEKFIYSPKSKLNELPKAPGVYALSSPKTILYIGKASNLKERVKNHFTGPTYRDDLFIKSVTKIGYIKTESDIDALLLESRLIKKGQPRYNVMWKDDKKYFYVAITKEELPRVFLTHQPVVPKLSLGAPKLSLGTAEYIGPFVEGKAIKRVLRLLRKVFPYYTQPQRSGAGYTAKKHPPLLCQYCHLQLCPGPAPDTKKYKKNIQGLIAVLKGKKTSVLKKLEKDMGLAAKNQDFEKAVELRDQFLALERIVSHARLLALEGSPSLNWSTMEKDLAKLFSTTKKITRIEAYDISNIQGKESTGSQVTFVKGVPAKEHYRKYKIHITGKANDFAMMEELVKRRLSHPEWPYPQIILIDGGKGQLSSALKALPKLSLGSSIQVVALAKKQNELFFPGKSKPILLKDLPRPLEHMFLHIRDEAHRFAISYHRLLRKKAMIRNA